MNALARRMRQDDCERLDTEIAGEGVQLDPAGVMLLPDQRTLIVSDLHIEKGAAFARRGMMLPPYDTAMTLTLLERVLARCDARRIICLGDSFHDRSGAERMPDIYRQKLVALMAGKDWVWISGNHDPEPPAGLGGDTCETLALGHLVLRHEPSAAPSRGEIAGHLHPVAKVRGAGRTLRGSCFVGDGTRLILPSFGVTTGGLNVLDRAFSGMFARKTATAFVTGMRKIYPIGFGSLC
ncbi:ligase-associated DNA damage response endonuclease PdeM [Fulvimarina sp. 2208YS6-2-32]|uniref:Ligase-associated DNA damage response endonuclease PdeM n=1 Tax=Fulvimarina uroteuthidis TaxID=3098149 RepID=A0ABU5I5S4_9HYPH|nr:ligase-associated DNA damage response endonuclease PdeM [Fulvimarina sp. 2208YS6-2-32]MDY8110720.1 ligase-associated DNA damage response endonuclease PdeM [Fulvimarina sp. 2208YS6-2-32]